MDDIFKFLLIGGILLFGLIRRAQKANAEAATPDKEPAQNPFIMEEEEDEGHTALDEWQKWFDGNTQEKVEETAILHQPIIKKDPPKIKKASVSLKNKNIATEIPEENIQLNSPEDARRAFIYSEIFNRKY